MDVISNIVMYLPCVREMRVITNYSGSQISLFGIIYQRFVQRMPEDVFHFVTVHHAHPLAPYIGTRSL